MRLCSSVSGIHTSGRDPLAISWVLIRSATCRQTSMGSCAPDMLASAPTAPSLALLGHAACTYICHYGHASFCSEGVPRGCHLKHQEPQAILSVTVWPLACQNLNVCLTWLCFRAFGACRGTYQPFCAPWSARPHSTELTMWYTESPQAILVHWCSMHRIVLVTSCASPCLHPLSLLVCCMQSHQIPMAILAARRYYFR